MHAIAVLLDGDGAPLLWCDRFGGRGLGYIQGKLALVPRCVASILRRQWAGSEATPLFWVLQPMYIASLFSEPS